MAYVIGSLIIFLVLLVLCVIVRRLRQGKPGTVFGKEILDCEIYIATEKGCSLHGVPDLVCRSKKGLLSRKQVIEIIDIKHRQSGQVHESDKIQLSVYAYILRQNNPYPEPVGSYGYILIKKGRFHTGYLAKIKLYNDKQIIKLYQR